MAGILEGASAPGKLTARELLDLIQTTATEADLNDPDEGELPAAGAPTAAV